MNEGVMQGVEVRWDEVPDKIGKEKKRKGTQRSTKISTESKTKRPKKNTRITAQDPSSSTRKKRLNCHPHSLILFFLFGCHVHPQFFGMINGEVKDEREQENEKKDKEKEKKNTRGKK